MRFTKYRKTIKFTYFKWNFVILLLCLLFMPSYVKFENTGDNLFHIFVNGIDVGSVAKLEEAENMLWNARREIAAASDDLVLMDVNMTYVGEEMLYGYVDDPQEVYSRIRKVLLDSIQEADTRSYTLKMDEYMVNLASVDELRQLLQAVISKYDSENKFGVEIVQEEGRLLNVLTARVVDRQSQQDAQEEIPLFPEAGIQAQLTELFAQEVEPEEKDFDDYDLGIMTMQFTEESPHISEYTALTDGRHRPDHRPDQ